MEIKKYLVGGAVRDQLLDIAVTDRDWLIVGATPALLLSQGYQQVGQDFPVFLHPQSKEEYALARTERKNGKGYSGFICDFSADITLEQDLIRRDLTINAIAQDESGQYHDPFNGIADLKQRVLRHISPAFSEDPLRVLRVARFAARFYALGFQIADETLQMMKAMVKKGELAHLTPERVWLETRKAFATENPEIYFRVLRDVGALAIFFPEVDTLFGIPQPVQHHPEIDTGLHTLLVLQQAVKLSGKSVNRENLLFAALCHDLGKALTPKSLLPKHHGHEQRGVLPTQQLANRLKIPTECKDFAALCAEFHSHIHRIAELRPETVIKLFNRFDVWRKPERFFDFLLVCEADSKGRLGFEEREYLSTQIAKDYYQVANEVSVKQVIEDGFEKEQIRDELLRRRILAIKQKKQLNG